MKKIVTHTNPDLDAVTSAWLIRRFLPGWEKAQVEFATADQKANDGPDELWVDVGRGKLDHHHTGEYLSATRLVWEYVQEARTKQPFNERETEALEELVEVVTQVDNARDLHWPEVGEFRYYLTLHTLIDGLRGVGESDEQVVELAMRALDAAFWQFKNKIHADRELAAGQEFETSWGKAIGLVSSNKQVLWLGEAKGYVLVLITDPVTGAARMYARPDSTVDLTMAYNKLREADPAADWFLHAGKKLLLNSSSVNPDMRPTKLTIKNIIRILKEN